MEYIGVTQCDSVQLLLSSSRDQARKEEGSIGHTGIIFWRNRSGGSEGWKEVQSLALLIHLGWGFGLRGILKRLSLRVIYCHHLLMQLTWYGLTQWNYK